MMFIDEYCAFNPDNPLFKDLMDPKSRKSKALDKFAKDNGLTVKRFKLPRRRKDDLKGLVQGPEKGTTLLR